jgi:hypothetical protein
MMVELRSQLHYVPAMSTIIIITHSFIIVPAIRTIIHYCACHQHHHSLLCLPSAPSFIIVPAISTIIHYVPSISTINHDVPAISIIIICFPNKHHQSIPARHVRRVLRDTNCLDCAYVFCLLIATST